MESGQVFSRRQIVKRLVGSDRVPDELSSLDSFSHGFQERTNIALLVEFPFIRSVRDFHVSILFWIPWVNEVVR